jgi:RNA polymerase sigma-70 factor (ECF subfamily)
LASFSQLSSNELARQCAGSRDPEAWDEFIRRFQPVIASSVFRTVRQWHEPTREQADDLVQETFLKLCADDCQMLRDFEPKHEDAIFGFLKIVTSNVVRDHFKSGMAIKRGAAQTDAIEEYFQLDGAMSGSNGEREIFRNLQLEEIDAILLKNLTGKDARRNRAIFWLRHKQGLRASEIAVVPSIDLSTEGVESVLLRMTDMIRSHMRNSGV